MLLLEPTGISRAESPPGCVCFRMRKIRWPMLCAGAMVAALCALVYWMPRRRDEPPPIESAAPTRPPEDARRAYAGPFQNVRPEVRYVGSAICANCHVETASEYARHPMGRSIVPIPAPSAAAPASHPRPFQADGSLFASISSLEKAATFGTAVTHRRTWQDSAGHELFRLDLPVQYVLGSGHHGHS